MRGLICKDLRLMMVQKNFLIMLAAVALVSLAAMDDPMFVIMYMTLIFTSFILSTMSYDEFDNGFPFLFTLPITRKLYVREKYVLALLSGAAAWVLTTLLSAGSCIFSDGALPQLSWFAASFMVLPMLAVLIALMIPFKLKFGSENSRMALVIAVAAVFALIGAVSGAMQAAGVSLDVLAATLPPMSMALCAALLIAFSAFICFCPTPSACGSWNDANSDSAAVQRFFTCSSHRIVTMKLVIMYEKTKCLDGAVLRCGTMCRALLLLGMESEHNGRIYRPHRTSGSAGS